MMLERARWAVADCATVVRRDLTHIVAQPSRIAWQLGFPMVTVLLFVFVFGSAMNIGPSVSYVAFVMPGMFTFTMALGFMNTAVAMVVDKDRGITDRFRAMPMATSAVATGRGVADLLLAAVDLTILAVLALVVGWRSGGGFLGTLAAFVLLLWLRFALIWVGVWLGLRARDQESTSNLFAIAFPFGMISGVFTPPELMPSWLGPIARWNPVSSTANAARELFGNPGVLGESWIEQHSVLAAVLWPLLITAIALPLAVRSFRRLES